MRRLRRTPRSSPASLFPARWHLREPQRIADTRTSELWRVRRDDGSTAVVKSIKPAGLDELRGAHLLRWRRGAGLIRLYAANGRHQLLEDAGDRALSRVIDEAGDNAATQIAADVLQRLSAPSRRSPPAGLQPLSAYFSALFAHARGRAVGDPYRDAARVAERLLRSARDERPLHGDLHHDNIFHSSRGWVAIDPKGLYGDVAFDAANLLYNPLERDDLCLDPHRLHHRAQTYADALQLELPQILAYAYAYGCLSAAWHAQDGNTADESRELAVAANVMALAREV
jgi:streptomycin 6-kinase